MSTQAQTTLEDTLGRGATNTGTIPSDGQPSPPACLDLERVPATTVSSSISEATYGLAVTFHGQVTAGQGTATGASASTTATRTPAVMSGKSRLPWRTSSSLPASPHSARLIMI